jgi:hypothetical protein
MNTNEQPYAELCRAIGKEETEQEFHQQIEEMNTTKDGSKLEHWNHVSTPPPEGVEVWAADCINPRTMARFQDGEWQREDGQTRTVQMWMEIEPEEPKTRCYRLKPELSDGEHHEITNDLNIALDRITEGLKSGFVGDSFTVEIIEMTQAELDNLPDI